MAASAPTILHVTADHPDAVEQAKTPVISRLIELTADGFDHRVLSLNRRSPEPWRWGWPRLALEETGSDAHLRSFVYRAPPAGLHHHRMLTALADALVEREAGAPRPDLIVGHKLTIEGIVVARMARALGIPYALSVQGNTDERILRARPDLHRLLRPVWHGAAQAFPFTPWALAAVEQRLGARSGPTDLLPCPLAHDTILPPKPAGNGLVTAFHLRNARLKNLDGMAKALDMLGKAGTDEKLSVVGGGSDAERSAARALGGERVQLEGALPNREIAARFNAATGFVLPSRRESFGLVFIEALFAGLPIAYPKGAAVDGYFADCPFAVAVDAADPASIADAMQRLIADEAGLKDALGEWQRSEAARRFTRPAIAETFRLGLERALRSKPRAS